MSSHPPPSADYYFNGEDIPKRLGLKIWFAVWMSCYVLFSVLGYITQTEKILRVRTTKGFSPLISLLVFFSNLARVFWWILEPFNLYLMLQSLGQVIVQLVLVICVARVLKQTNERKSHFWYWPTAWPYIAVYSALIAIFAILDGALWGSKGLATAMSILATATECMYPLPQIYRAWKDKSTKAFSVPLALVWSFGDTIKLCIFFASKPYPPLQMFICMGISIFEDWIVFGQVCYYSWWLPRKAKKAAIKESATPILVHSEESCEGEDFNHLFEN